MGISVKSRSRSIGKESEPLNIPADDFDKATKACQAFDCIPYFAIVVDAGDKMYVFVLAMSELLKTFREGRKVCAWKMGPKDIEQYRKNPKIIMVEFTYRIHRWFS